MKCEKIKHELSTGQVETRQLGMIGSLEDTTVELNGYPAWCCKTPVSASYYLFLHLAIVYHYDERNHADTDRDCSGNKSNALPVNSTCYL